MEPMQTSETMPACLQASKERPTRERIGMLVSGADAAAAVAGIKAAEAVGVQQIWMG